MGFDIPNSWGEVYKSCFRSFHLPTKVITILWSHRHTLAQYCCSFLSCLVYGMIVKTEPSTSACYLEVGYDYNYQWGCQLLLFATWKSDLTTSINCQGSSYFCLLPGSWIWLCLKTVSVPATSACFLEFGSDNIYQLSVCQLLLLLTTIVTSTLPGRQVLLTPNPCCLEVGSDYIYQLSMSCQCAH